MKSSSGQSILKLGAILFLLLGTRSALATTTIADWPTSTTSYNSGGLAGTSVTYAGDAAWVHAQTDMGINTGYESGLTATMTQTSPGVWVVSYTSGVPEPETYAMMAIGLSMMGWAARRRRNALQGNQSALVSA